jgi:hypothetical protein
MSMVGSVGVAALAATVGIVLAGPAAARPAATVGGRPAGRAAARGGGAPLPSPVATAIRRARNVLNAASTDIDTKNSAGAVTALSALPVGIVRADKAARKQMHTNPNADSPPGPDSVVAVLTFDQKAITTLAALFDGQSGAVVDKLGTALSTTLKTRYKLLAVVIALPAEGAGADYSDGMADTVPGYDSEVAGISAALSSDTLSARGRQALESALAQAKKARAAIDAAFGGGE